MTHVEQGKIIAELRDYERNMNRAEQEEFHMFVQRNKDDEDLDDIAKNKLLLLHERLIVNRPRKIVKSPFGDISEQ